MQNQYAVPITETTNIIHIRDQEASEVLRIDHDGRIFWKQREVETDDEFRAAMLELKDALVKNMMPHDAERPNAKLTGSPGKHCT